MTIKSVSYSQENLLTDIINLHCNGSIEADVTFGNGAFWKGRQMPVLAFDLEPMAAGVVKADARCLPLRSESLSSIVCDLPFLTYITGGRGHKGGAVSMASRFSGYYSYEELSNSYCEVLRESARCLRKGGVLIFKCQDIINNHRIHPTHAYSIGWAREYGLRLLDLFVLAASHRMPSPQKGRQRHARIHHSYFLVFKKESDTIRRYVNDQAS